MAPPAVVYVVAAVVSVAAVFAFKEFVYEPHLAPKIEAWAENFLERRRTARNRRGSAVPVRSSRRRPSNGSDGPNPPTHDNGPQTDRGEDGRVPGSNDFSVDEFELEALASREVDEWRNEVLRSQERTRDGLRNRRTNKSKDVFDGFDSMSTTLDDSFTSLTHTPLASTHVISNVSSPITQSTISLPQTPTRRGSVSQSTTAQGDALFVASHSPSSIHGIPVMSPRAASPNSVVPTPCPPSDNANRPDVTPPLPLAIPIAGSRSPTSERVPRPLPFTPTYQVMSDDSPFGPLLPDTPRSSAEMYGERPFSPITRVMGSSSGATDAGETLSSSINSTSSIRTFRGSVVRKPSALANEVTNGSEDSSDEDHPVTSASTYTVANPGLGTNDSVISSLSERYPAPPTPPVILSPPASSVGVISAPSSPRSGGSEVVVHVDATSSPQTQPPPPLLQLPSEPSSPGRISSGHSATSPTFSYASFLSLMPARSAASESEGDEFLSMASDDDDDGDDDDDDDWRTSPVTASRPAGPVQDREHNPFLDFEHVAHAASRSGSDHGSDGSEVLVSEHAQGSEVGSDESWGSARKH